MRALGRMRVVRDHDDGLAVFVVERLEQRQDLVAGLAVQVTGGLVAQQQRGISDDGARDADALFLSARQLARAMLRAMLQAHQLQRSGDARHALLAIQSW